MKKFASLSMIAAMFMDKFTIFRSPFDFYYYYFFYLICIFFLIAHKKTFKLLPGWFFIPLLILIATSIVAGNLYGTLTFNMAKQFLGLGFSSIAFYSLLQLEDFNIKKLFNLYLTGSFWVAVYGIFTEFLLIAHIPITRVEPTSTGFFRIFSIMGEPYYLAVILIPALYYYANLMFGTKAIKNRLIIVRFVVILICFIFTFSTAGYMALILMILFILFNKKFFSLRGGRIIVLPVILFMMLLGYGQLKEKFWEIQVRIDDSLIAFTSGGKLKKEQYDKLNTSSFAMYSNFVIALYSYQRNPYIGSGLGGHLKTYNDKIVGFFGKEFMVRYGGTLNAHDASSLFLRLMSETGITGLTLFFIFMFRFFVWKRGINDPKIVYYTVINQGIFILLVIRIIRTGNYISNGFFFFFFLYYLTWKIIKTYRKTGELPFYDLMEEDVVEVRPKLESN